APPLLVIALHEVEGGEVEDVGAAPRPEGGRVARVRVQHEVAPAGGQEPAVLPGGRPAAGRAGRAQGRDGAVGVVALVLPDVRDVPVVEVRGGVTLAAADLPAHGQVEVEAAVV